MRRLLLLVPLTACAPEAEGEPCTACALTDANTFAYESELHIGTLPLPERTDVLLRWDGLVRDLRGEALDSSSITEARLVAFRGLSPEEVTDGLSNDALEQAEVSAYATCAPEDAACALSAFGMFGNTLDIPQYLVEGYATWLLALGGDGVDGVDGLAFLAPRADSDVAEVRVEDAGSSLAADVDVCSLTPVVVARYQAGISLDWSGVTRDGRGAPLNPETVDELWVGRFTEPVEELGARAFELETLAEQVWTMDVEGRTAADLSGLAGDEPFHGVGSDGTWVAALRCRGCTNPAPRVLTILGNVAP